MDAWPKTGTVRVKRVGLACPLPHTAPWSSGSGRVVLSDKSAVRIRPGLQRA
jgi:hypothetical protein